MSHAHAVGSWNLKINGSLSLTFQWNKSWQDCIRAMFKSVLNSSSLRALLSYPTPPSFLSPSLSLFPFLLFPQLLCLDPHSLPSISVAPSLSLPSSLCSMAPACDPLIDTLIFQSSISEVHGRLDVWQQWPGIHLCSYLAVSFFSFPLPPSTLSSAHTWQA